MTYSQAAYKTPNNNINRSANNWGYVVGPILYTYIFHQKSLPTAQSQSIWTVQFQRLRHVDSPHWTNFTLSNSKYENSTRNKQQSFKYSPYPTHFPGPRIKSRQGKNHQTSSRRRRTTPHHAQVLIQTLTKSYRDRKRYTKCNVHNSHASFFIYKLFLLWCFSPHPYLILFTSSALSDFLFRELPFLLLLHTQFLQLSKLFH